MTNDLISVIVPVYNAEDYLERCVDSILNQTYENLEVILVDDGSTDDSGNICEKYAAEEERIKVLHKQNGGLISAWKCGVEGSSGDYLSFVDSDDWIDGNMIMSLAEHLSGTESEIISSDYIIEHENGDKQNIWQALKPGVYEEADMRNVVHPQLLGKETRPVCLSRCMKLISAKLVRDNMKYSDSRIQMGEDITIMLPALLDCRRLVILDHKAFYHYLYLDSSMVHRYDKTMYENMRLLRTIIQTILKDKLVGLEREQIKKQADKEYIILLLLVVKNEVRGNAKGYRNNIMAIAGDKEVQDVVAATPMKFTEKSNMLLYLTLCHPGNLTIGLLRMAMIAYYSRK